jgi:hypothetical protein
MNELVRFADHIHYNLTKLLLNYYDAKDLSIEQEELLKELYVAREENHLEFIESIPYKPNIHLKKLDMAGKEGMFTTKGKNPINNLKIKTENNPSQLDYDNNLHEHVADAIMNPLDTIITSIDGDPLPLGNDICQEIIAMFQSGKNANDVYAFCQKKVAEKSLTLKDAFKIALLKDRNPKDEIESFDHFNLASKINSGGELALEDWPKIRSSVGKSWKHIPEILGFCWKYIDNLKAK